ncbi:MAG: hypothetical protein PVJ52_02350 [Candidatus Woesebacteria bacterium]|jgi:hypothetical protein
MEEQKENKPQEKENTDKTTTKTNLVKKIPKVDLKGNLFLGLAAFIVVLAGLGTGWLLSGTGTAQKSASPVEEVAPGAQKDGKEAGIADEETFRDSAEGILVEGGIDGEGTHHLDRGLGPTKDVYLTSTVIDLQNFVDKKVMIWGETISAQKAGWLMDVGKIKVVE